MQEKKTKSALFEQQNIAGRCQVIFPIIKFKSEIPKVKGSELFINLS